MKIFKSTPEHSMADESAMTILRISVGCMMAFGHGLGKLPPHDGFIAGVSALGFPAPEFFAWLAALAEFGGGLLLAVGFLTRFNALALSLTMLVAAFGRHLADPFKVKELSLLYLVVFILFMIKGSGKWSLDHFFSRKG